MNAIEIPRYIDEPPTILLWSIDELVPFIFGLVIGMQIGHALICTLLGLILTRIYQRYLDQNSDGFINHWLYWHGFTLFGSITIPNPYEREFC
ncbi:MAG: type IV conjugative transfer system protein TraL [Succinivibrionaceae bacterium]|nr:type IV conjugative transfer system protein TraL [Ruminobacter sp.]MDY5779569.1 type IV conjugative transfer system protein TraL [Succinivibrionaceae bacterium]MEE1341051.1 type IV conjugative transfer system protein TraL [Succinivibrionaceae bacterium]